MPPPLHHSVIFSLKGLRLLWRAERSFRLETIGFILTLVVGLALRLTPNEWTAVLLASGLVFCAEAANTVCEKILDHLHPTRHETVGMIKDMAAGMVLLSVITAISVACVILWQHLIGA